jgi:hypothetical protein
LVIRLPEDSLDKLRRKASFALLKLNDALVAALFVFTTIGIYYSSMIGPWLPCHINTDIIEGAGTLGFGVRNEEYISV